MTTPISLPLEVALYFVQQLPPDYQKAIFEWLLSSYSQKTQTEAPKQETWQPLPLKRGAGKHLIGFIAADFNAPLEDFKEYM
jgi:hypothetical protein